MDYSYCQRDLRNDRMSLFRKQALDNQYDNMWGQVCLSQPLSYQLLGAFFLTIVGVCLTFLFSTEYHRKERVSGMILPNEGILQLNSPGHLSVAERYVNQGDSIVQGQPLLRLTAPILFGSGENEVEVKIIQLKKQISLLSQQATTTEELAQQKLAHLRNKLKEQEEQLKLLILERSLVLAQLEFNKTRANKHKPLLTAGLISDNLVSQLQEQHHRLQREAHSIERAIKKLEEHQQQNIFEIAKLPKSTKQQLDQIALSISDKQQSLVNLQASTDILLTASTDGTVATVDVYKNQWLQPQQLMMSILPLNSTLHAELHIPTRAYGFIRKGQTTKVKLEAFPFEKFGSIDGVVLDKPTHTQGELGVTPNSFNYKVKVQLKKQTISAYGEEISLLSGMRLAADILIDKRTLLEWLLAPLYSLKG